MTDERRDYFRVHDRVALRVAPIMQCDTSSAEQMSHDALFGLLNELRAIDEDNAVLLRTISEKSRDLGLYLKTQQRKIELLARHITLSQIAHQFSYQDINLGGNGLGIRQTTSAEIGARLLIELILFPQVFALRLETRVVSIKKMPEHFVIGLEFDGVTEQDRDIIIRHCLQIEANLRRKEKEKDE